MGYLLMLAVAVIGSNSLLLSPILSNVARDLSVTPVQVAWAMTAYNVATALSALFLTRFIDNWGTRKALLIAYGCLMVGIALSAVSLNIMMLVCGQALAGVGSGVALPAIYTLAPLTAPKGQESKAIGRVLTGWSLSLVLGVPLSAYLAAHYNWRTAYYLLFVLVLSVFALMVAVAKRFPITGTHDKKPSGRGWNIFAPFLIAGAAPLLIMNLLFMMALYGAYAYLGTYLQSSYGATAVEAGYAVLAYGLGFGLASFADTLLDKLGVRRLALSIFVILMVIYLILSPPYGSLIYIDVICLVWGFFNHLGMSVVIALLSDIKTPIKGWLMGMNSVCTYVGGSLGTSLGGVLYSYQGFVAVALAATFALGVIALLFVTLVSRPAKSPA